MTSARPAREMRILVAPDKFKGSLGAREVAENIAPVCAMFCRMRRSRSFRWRMAGRERRKLFAKRSAATWVTCRGARSARPRDRGTLSPGCESGQAWRDGNERSGRPAPIRADERDPTSRNHIWRRRNVAGRRETRRATRSLSAWAAARRTMAALEWRALWDFDFFDADGERAC